jgi:hypothetical protein
MTDIRSIDELFQAAPAKAHAVPSSSIKRDRPIGLSLFALTIFLSAFLLFQVQPLIGKLILPWFGGSASVWSTCMLCFQVLLFGGYAYAHLTTSRLSPRTQAALHSGLLIAACITLPILPSDSWKPTGDANPIWGIITLLALTLGLPFFALSATGPLLQSWFSRTYAGRSPYRLYALSNAGSLLALISYPAVFDWQFATRALARFWSWGFVGFVALCAACAVTMAGRSRQPILETIAESDPRSSPESAASPLPFWQERPLWFVLAMIPSILLLATTNQVCLEVASVPFLWVLPLTLYLLSFILCFDNDRWYSRRLVMPACAAAMIGVFLVRRVSGDSSMVVQILVYFAALFLCAMVCHGELARRRPSPRHLTGFYLLLAAGGAGGGIFVGILAPSIFNNYYELHVGLFGCALVMLVVLYADRRGALFAGQPRSSWLIMLTAFGAFTVALIADAWSEQHAGLIPLGRNFYGVLRLNKCLAPYENTQQPLDELWHGRIVHGSEYAAPVLRKVPTTYYCPESGIGRVLSEPSRERSLLMRVREIFIVFTKSIRWSCEQPVITFIT